MQPEHPGDTAFIQAQNALNRRSVLTAIQQFDRAQAMGYPSRECSAGRWTCWMLLGDFERAWCESDRIAADGSDDVHRFWTGEQWAGKRVMLRCLHGLGDTVQFIRYAPLLKQTCHSLSVQTHPEVVRLVNCVAGIDCVSTWGPNAVEDASQWDMQMEINELPRAFRTNMDNVPQTVPYITIPSESVRSAAQQIASDHRLKVGVTWKASAWDVSRDVPLNQMAQLFDQPDCAFYTTQKDVDPSLTQYAQLQSLAPYASDVYDTAALICNLDLVITVDTMTAHLAGALGVPVWILLPARADWRWMLTRSDTPWYPTARLFRQVSAGGLASAPC